MKKRISRALALFLLPPLGALLIRFLYLTNKKHFHIDNSVTQEPTIFATWHGNLLMLPFLYKKYRQKPHAKVLISDHFDGLLISKTIKYFGLETIAGSTNRQAVKALLQGIKALKEGYDIGITPDGPKGPRHSVSDGVIIMAQKTKADVVLLSIQPTKYWEFRSWDRFKVPKPFGTLHYYSKKIDISNLDMETARKKIQEGLMAYEH